MMRKIALGFVVVGATLLVVPSLVLPSNAWSADEVITVRIGEPFVVPERGRYLVLDGTETQQLIALDSFTRSPTVLSNRNIDLRTTSEAKFAGGFQLEVNAPGPEKSGTLLLGDFGVDESQELWFGVAPGSEDHVGGSLGNLSIDQVVLDIQKTSDDRLQDRVTLGFLGLLSLAAAGAALLLVRSSKPL